MGQVMFYVIISKKPEHEQVVPSTSGAQILAQTAKIGMFLAIGILLHSCETIGIEF